jgi:hypothetical protein
MARKSLSRSTFFPAELAVFRLNTVSFRSQVTPVMRGLLDVRQLQGF